MDDLIKRYGVLRHTYRNTPLYLTDEQKLKLERSFGISRALRNRLMSQLKDEKFEKIDEAYRRLKPWAADAAKDLLDYTTPQETVLLESELHAVVADIVNLRHNPKDVFVRHRGIQTAWILDPFYCRVDNDRFEVPGISRGIKIPPSRIHHPGYPVAARIMKYPSHYQLSLLYEEKAKFRHTYQDVKTTQLGLMVLQAEQTSFQQEDELKDYHPAWIWRKQILDRLMWQLVRRRQSEVETAH